MRVSHTEVDADGLEWAKYLAEHRVGIVPSRLSSGVLGRTGRDSID